MTCWGIGSISLSGREKSLAVIKSAWLFHPSGKSYYITQQPLLQPWPWPTGADVGQNVCVGVIPETESINEPDLFLGGPGPGFSQGTLHHHTQGFPAAISVPQCAYFQYVFVCLRRMDTGWTGGRQWDVNGYKIKVHLSVELPTWLVTGLSSLRIRSDSATQCIDSTLLWTTILVSRWTEEVVWTFSPRSDF